MYISTMVRSIDVTARQFGKDGGNKVTEREIDNVLILEKDDDMRQYYLERY